MATIKPAIVQQVYKALGYPPGQATVAGLVQTTGLAASTVRVALGVLYGEGLARVSGLVDGDGEPVWSKTTAEERGEL